MLPPTEPTSNDIQAGLNAVVRDTLRPAAWVLVLAYISFTILHPFVLPPASRFIMTGMAAGTLLISLALGVYFLRVEIPAAHAQQWAGLMVGLVVINMAVHMYLTPTPDLMANILVLMVASGCFLLSHAWLAAALISNLLIWIGGIVLSPTADWAGTVHLVLVSILVSLFVYRIRYRTLSRYELLRLEDARLTRELQQTTERLEARAKVEHVLTGISTRLMDLSAEEIDRAVDQAMEAVGECFQADHVCVCRVDGNPATFTLTHEWCGPDVASRKPHLQKALASNLPWCWKQLEADQHVQIDFCGEMVPEAETDKAFFEASGICSFFAVPLAMKGRTRGILALATDNRSISWPTDTASLLRVLGEILVASLKRKKAEEEISELNQRLEQASRLVGLGEMAANLAHDLTNGLSAISLQTKAANRKASRGKLTLEKCQEYIEDIEKQSDRLTTMLTTIQKFARNRASEYVPLDLADVFRDLEILIGGKLRQRDVQLHYEDVSNCPPLVGDAAQITLVVLNIVLNAVQAMAKNERDKRRIAISISNNDSEWVEVSIRDQGPGVPPESIEKIFEKFYTTKTEGLGLGLAFSRSYIEQHGGKLWCISQPGQGSDFRFTLPLPS